MSATDVKGRCEDRFAAVRDAFAANFASGADVGASFSATVEGETVVDLWGGYADEAKTKPWEENTIVNVYSTTKTMCALTAHLCADRGLLDFAAPVATYWPEFGQNGKDKVTVAQLMSHSSGVSGFEQKIAPEELYDWDRVCRLLAKQAPWWEPGTRSGYHAVTQGYLVGEVVRRVAGKTMGTLFREDIAGPLGADFHIGLPPEADARCGEMIPPERALLAATPGGEIAQKTLGNPVMTALEPRTTAWRRAEIPAAGGFGNARSVARIQAILANDGKLGGKQFLGKAAARRPLELQIDNTDLVLGIPVRFGLGYGMPTPVTPFPHADTVFWGGWGGSLILVDYEARMTMSYVMNKMNSTTTGDARVAGMIFGIYAGLAA